MFLRSVKELVQYHHVVDVAHLIICISFQRSFDSVPAADMHSLSVNSRPVQIKVRERSRLVDEKISRQVEEQIDEWTGETVLKTIEFIEKTIEHEVKDEHLIQKSLCLKLTIGHIFVGVALAWAI